MCGTAGIHHRGPILSNHLQATCCSKPYLNFKGLILNRFLPFSPCFIWIGQLVFVLLLFVIARGFVLRGDLGTYPSDFPMCTGKFGFPFPVGQKMCLSNVCLLAGYLNVLVNSQWKSRWCQIKDGHLHFYQDKNRSKLAEHPLSLAGCEIIPEPSPDHLYSFRILHNGEERVVMEVGCMSVSKKASALSHQLGCLSRPKFW